MSRRLRCNELVGRVNEKWDRDQIRPLGIAVDRRWRECGAHVLPDGDFVPNGLVLRFENDL
jgi:hypothetical protein